MNKVKQRLRIFFKKAKRTEECIEEQFGFTDTSNAFLACVTAIICMKDSIDEPMSDMILLSLFIILVISLCNLFNSPNAIVICCVVFLFVAMGQADADMGPVIHSVYRFTDTVIGLIVSFLVNRFLFNPAKKPEGLDDEDADENKRQGDL